MSDPGQSSIADYALLSDCQGSALVSRGGSIDAVAGRLTDERGFVYRYRSLDGLAGEEATFGVCTYWLAHALALAGEVGRAQACFDTVSGFANDVGLLAEEIDSATGELLGNFPQAFTHIGLVNAANAIADVEQRPTRR